MKCPVCNHDSTKVNDSRLTSEGEAVRRRRECTQCGFRFSTLEERVILDLQVIKKSGRAQPYSREKLERGLKRALEKRPLNQEQFHKLISSIEIEIQRRRNPDIQSTLIGELILNFLYDFDKVAYIRFASVYREYNDISGFQAELVNLEDRIPPTIR